MHCKLHFDSQSQSLYTVQYIAKRLIFTPLTKPPVEGFFGVN